MSGWRSTGSNPLPSGARRGNAWVLRDEGVTVELSEVAGGAKAIEALLGGSVDVAAGSMSDVIQVAARGSEIRGFLVLYARPTLALAIAPTRRGAIRTIGDLRGRNVGVSAPGSATHQFLDFLLVSNGLTPEDVSTVSVGMAASSVGALEHDTVDAAVLVGSAIATWERRHEGNTLLADTRTPGGARRVFGSDEFPALSLLSEDGWLVQHADTAQRFVRAVKRGVLWVRNNSPEDVRQMIPEGSRMATVEGDCQAIREAQAALSVDGLMPAGSAERIERFVAVRTPTFVRLTSISRRPTRTSLPRSHEHETRCQVIAADWSPLLLRGGL